MSSTLLPLDSLESTIFSWNMTTTKQHSINRNKNNQTSVAMTQNEDCCCTIESLLQSNNSKCCDEQQQHTVAGESNCVECSNGGQQQESRRKSAKHLDQQYDDYLLERGDNFVNNQRQLTRNLLLMSLSSSVVLGVMHCLISVDRYFFGSWTFLGLSIAFLISALSVYYAQACVTCFGPNRVLTLAVCFIIVYVFVHFFASFVLFQLASIGLALCLGPFYSAQLEFISNLASRLVHLTPTVRRQHEERNQRMLHLLLFCPSNIIGHFLLISLHHGYLRILGEKGSNEIHSMQSNHSEQSQHWNSSQKLEFCTKYPCLMESHKLELSSSSSSFVVDAESRSSLCGRLFQQQHCNQALYYIFSFSRYQQDLVVKHGAVKPYSDGFINLLLGTFLLVSLSVLVVMVLLLHRTQHLQVQDPMERSFLSSSIRNVLFRTLHDQHLRLLLPMAFFVGLEQGFFTADFNKLYVSCVLGLDSITLVMLTRGCVHLGATLLVHEFVRHIHRPLILLSGAICQLGVLAILCLWQPNDDLPLYYVIAACWALANAIWETLLLTNILRTFCPEEWNYALLTVYSFTNLGLGASFGVSEFVCLYIKLYGLMAALVVAIVPMKVCEMRLVKLEKILGLGSASHV